MAKTKNKPTAKPKVKKSSAKPKIEKGPIPQIWKCKVSWVNYKNGRFVKDQEIMVYPGTEDDQLRKYFKKVETKVETIISEPVELAEGV